MVMILPGGPKSLAIGALHTFTSCFIKKIPVLFLAHNLRQMLTDIHNSFTDGLNSKRVMKWSLKI